MNALLPSWSVEKPWNESMHWLQERLSGAGLRLLQTFDLQNARSAATACPCPHHGTSQCDCQLMVVLVYAEDCTPITLVLHGSQGQSWISVVDRPDQRADPRTVVAVQRALRLDPESAA